MSQKAVAEGGFGLITNMHVALLKKFLDEVGPHEKKGNNPDADKQKAIDDEEEDQLLAAAKKHVENYEIVWPEMIRLVLTSTHRFDFHPLDEQT